MKHTYFYLFIIGINCFNISYSQNTEKLLIVNFQDREYFAPDIINCLNNLMVHKKDNISKAFDKIIVLNQLQSHITEQAGIKNLTDYFKQDSKYIDLSEDTKKMYDTISKYLGDYNSFLDIKMNQINQLIEVQFSLYSNIIKKGISAFPTKDPSNPDEYQSAIFIPLERNYLYILEEKIKRLFPETNLSPTSIISINGKQNVKGVEFYFSTQDTISLDGSYSSDPDSRSDDLKYYWRVINTKSTSVSPLLKNIDKQQMNINLLNPGKYCFGLKINDGIANSPEDTICLNILLKPQIYIQNTKVESYYQLSNSVKKNPQFKYCLNIASNSFNTKKSFLIIKDMNETSFFETFNPLIISEDYISSNIKVPHLDTINNLLIHNYYTRYITVDSVTTPEGGYKIYFSGSPSSSIYRFQIQEQYKGVNSNSYEVEFKSNFLSRTKLLYRFQRSNLSSKKFPVNDTTSNLKSFRYSNSNDFFLSNHFTKTLVLDLNIGSFLHHRDSDYIKKYVPYMQISYEFGTPEYLILAPAIAYGSFSNDYIHNATIFGIGIDFKFNINSAVFLTYGIQYLTGFRNGISGAASNFGLIVDLKKIIQKLNNSNFINSNRHKVNEWYLPTLRQVKSDKY